MSYNIFITDGAMEYIVHFFQTYEHLVEKARVQIELGSCKSLHNILGVNFDLESIYSRLIHLLEWGVIKTLRHIF